MTKFQTLLFITGLLILTQACQKEEKPVPKHQAGDIITASASMGSDYKWQIYYDLKTNREVGKNLKTEWDMGFEASADGYHIILNTAKGMYAFNTLTPLFDNITDTSGFGNGKKIDLPSGNLDSTAIGDWRTDKNVYLIEKGYNEAGTHLGFCKVRFLSVSESSFEVKIANLNGSNAQTLTITKDDTYNFTFLSLETNTTLLIEPPKADWDIVFTQYTHIFYEPEEMPYLVVGCLLNRHSTFATKESDKEFLEINLDFAESLQVSDHINTIGYDWKTYSFNTGSYVTNLETTYIIQDSEEYYYKLRFIDFHDDMGVKGTPVWEYQQL